MMTRIKGQYHVHFRNPADMRMCLCGANSYYGWESDLFGSKDVLDPLPETHDRVTCPVCAKVYCAAKNEPWNTIADSVLERGVYAAVEDCEEGEPVSA